MANLPQQAQRFPSLRRIKSPQEFAQVFEHGKVQADLMLVVHARLSPDSTTQLGLSVSKKVGNAPHRNLWKRLIRESFRRNLSEIPSHMQLVVRPRRGAQPKFAEIQRSLCDLAKILEKKLRRS